MDIDLKAFCAYPDQQLGREYLEEPFSAGAYSYATNGHMLVRVPRRDDVAESVVKGEWDKPLRRTQDLLFVPLELSLPPPPKVGPCAVCGGVGIVHGDVDCQPCSGRGWVDPELDISTNVAGAIFCLSYIRRVGALPGVRIAPSSVGETKAYALQFEFDGGIGAVMPMRWHCDTVVETWVAPQP